MHSLYTELLQVYPNADGLYEAILSGNEHVYRLLTGYIIQHSKVYKEIVETKGKSGSRMVVSDTLTILRRQVKAGVARLYLNHGKLFLGKTDLLLHIDRLLLLFRETGPLSEIKPEMGEAELNLINGYGFRTILRLKPGIMRTLANFGCHSQSEREEIFSESLIILWKKLVNNEIGIIQRNSQNHADRYQVYHKRYFQHSNLNTFLTGIVRFLFMNRCRSRKRRFTDITDNISEPVNLPDTGSDVEPVAVLYRLYRIFYKPRRLRTLISLLQYDCGLEEGEVCRITGHNNCRIHSYRLRRNFHLWYRTNIGNLHRVTDAAYDYHKKCEAKLRFFNRKIRVLISGKDDPGQDIPMDIFREEFTDNIDFQAYRQEILDILYLVQAGKAGSLKGIPDEAALRRKMSSFRQLLRTLEPHHEVMYLLYYGSDEPPETIVNLLKELAVELAKEDPEERGVFNCGIHLNNIPSDTEELTNRLRIINTYFFSTLSKLYPVRVNEERDEIIE